LTSIEPKARSDHRTHRYHTRWALAASAILLGTIVLLWPTSIVIAQRQHVPTAVLVHAPTLRMPGSVDSNSPVVADLSDGQAILNIVTSWGGQPSLASGPSLTLMGPPALVGFESHPGGGLWMESIVVDDAGTWYGYYHNEVPATLCNRPDRALPRIGAARSRDRGRTWEDLGIILEAPPGWQACATPNRYVVGGVGDVDAVLDRDVTYLYLFFSQYSQPSTAQGVAVARMPWASRDNPIGRADIWVDGIWQPAQSIVIDESTVIGNEDHEPHLSWIYPAGTPLVRPTHPWHDADRVNDAFWGASLHWNNFLGQYVMVLNRAKDEAFAQEGIYVSFAPSLDDPSLWSPPQRILQGGQWYPQVVSLVPSQGPGIEADARARFFMGGTSTFYIDFER
jgi:hypothetical protein